MNDKIELHRRDAKARLQSVDRTLRLLLRYLPLTVFLTFASIYILYQYTLDPENYLSGSVLEPHAQRIYSLLIGFNVMCWSCIIYYFKSKGAFKKLGSLIILISCVPLIYELIFYFDTFAIFLMGISLYWLYFAFKPHDELIA